MDPLHKTLPFITKYERAKILGERAKQLNAVARPFVVVSDEIIDGDVMALMEFEQKKLQMIIRRPLPNNGCEYWRVSDLENLI
jgi:DNA-directed RNA polymerase I, II, and III subunit RPABC2